MRYKKNTVGSKDKNFLDMIYFRNKEYSKFVNGNRKQFIKKKIKLRSINNSKIYKSSTQL